MSKVNNPPTNSQVSPAELQRTMPQSIPAEVGVLGSMIVDSDCIGSVLQIVDKNCFSRPDHQIIYETLLQMWEANKPIDLLLLKETLKRKQLLEEVGGVEYLVRVAESVPSAANAEYYARIVRDKAMLRGLISAATDVLREAYEQRDDAPHILDNAERIIFEATEKRIVGAAEPLSEILRRTYEAIEARGQGHLSGIASGFAELDEIMGGFHKGEMIILAARPSVGKTALAVNIAEHMGVVERVPVAMFSLEMSAQQLAERMLCARAGIDSAKLRRGMLSAEEYQQLAMTSHGELAEAPILVDDTPTMTVLELRAKARRLKRQHDIQCVFVDYLQLMSSPGAESRQIEISQISQGLKSLARELDVAVVALSQIRRAAEDRAGHRPLMSDLRESGSLEQDADVVLLLHREDIFHRGDPNYQNNNEAELIIAKQRNGPTGRIDLIFDERIMKFHTRAPQHIPEPEEPF